MAFIEAWQAELKTTFHQFGKLIPHYPHIDVTYGFLAAALLWPAREAFVDDEVREALRAICEDETVHILRAMRRWQDDPLAAARTLAQQSKDNAPLTVALDKLLVYFLPKLLQQNLVEPRAIEIGGDVTGAIVNIDGIQYVYGDVAINQTVVRETQPACPTAPAPPYQFTGRDGELQRLRRLLTGENGAIPALYGMGGIGKTTLVQALCHRPNFPFTAVLWATITQSPQSAALLQTWGRYADSEFTLAPNTPLELVADNVRALLTELVATRCGGKALVVLDDVWYSEACYRTVTLLKKAAPSGSRLMLTTRQEQVIYALGAHRVELGELSDSEAATLLHKLVQNPAVSAEHIGRTAGLLHGHPLALELAAVTLNLAAEETAHIEEILADYRQGLRAGTPFDEMALDAGTPKSLNVVFGRSYSELDDDLQMKFRALGVLAPNAAWDRSLAGAVWGVDDQRKRRTYHQALRTRALIRKDAPPGDEDGQPWYRQHPLLRTYARALLQREKDGTEYRTAADAYVDYLQNVVLGYSLFSSDEWEPLFNLQAHILEAVNLLAREENYEQAARLQILFDRYLQRWGAYQTLIEQHRQFPDSMGSRLVMLSRLHRGNACLELADYQNALVHYTVAGEIAFQSEEDADVSGVFGSLANGYFSLGEREKALTHYQYALQAARRAKRGELAAKWHNGIGRCYRAGGKIDQALEQYQLAQTLVEQNLEAPAVRDIEVSIAINVGFCFKIRGQLDKAIDQYRQALLAARGAGNKKGEATALGNLGDCYALQAKGEQAYRYLQQALETCDEIGFREGKGNFLHSLAELLIDEGDYGQAVTTAREGATLGTAINRQEVIGDNNSALVRAYLCLDDLNAATMAVHLARQPETPLKQHYALALQGVVALRRRESAVAQEAFRASVEQSAALLAREPRNFEALYTQGLAHYGLALCARPAHVAKASAAYARARTVNEAAGVVARALNLLDQLATVDEEKLFAVIKKVFAQ